MPSRNGRGLRQEPASARHRRPRVRPARSARRLVKLLLKEAQVVDCGTINDAAERNAG